MMITNVIIQWEGGDFMDTTIPVGQHKVAQVVFRDSNGNLVPAPAGTIYKWTLNQGGVVTLSGDDAVSEIVSCIGVGTALADVKVSIPGGTTFDPHSIIQGTNPQPAIASAEILFS